MKNKKRILYIEANQDGTIGGSHYCLLEIVKTINKNKFEPLVLFFQNNILVPEFKKYCKLIIIDKPNVLILKNSYPEIYDYCCKSYVLKILLTVFQKAYNFTIGNTLYSLKVIQILSKNKIDIVHINDAPVLTHWLIIAKLLRIKCISHLRGNWQPTFLQRLLTKYYDCIISISNSVTNHVKTNNVSDKNIITIYDGIDVNNVLNEKKTKFNRLKKELNIPSNSFLIGVIGNIKKWKGQHIAIEAIKILKNKNPNVTCLIVGDVSVLEEDVKYFNYLKEIVYTYNLHDNIIFLGYRHDVADIVSILDVLVHTSTQPEPFGRVILEGMIFSKPVIATAHGGPLEIIENGVTGYLTDPFDKNSLSQKILYIMSNKNACKIIGSNARKSVEKKFNIEKNVSAIEQVYSTM